MRARTQCVLCASSSSSRTSAQRVMRSTVGSSATSARVVLSTVDSASYALTGICPTAPHALALSMGHLYCRYDCPKDASAGTVWRTRTEVSLNASMLAMSGGQEMVTPPYVPSARASPGLHL